MANDKEKTAIITGAGGGIGRELSRLMATRGAHVVACDLKESAAVETAAMILAAGGSAEAKTLNVTDYDCVQALADEIVSRLGSIDYLFNNAGIGIGGEARDFSINDWRAVLDVNLYGVINGITAVYPIMANQGAGHIMNTSSLDGLVPFPMHVSYTASKYAVVGLSQALRIEGAPLGVRVSVACPGRVETTIFDTTRLVNSDRKKTMRIVKSAPAITAETCARRIISGMDRNEELILPSAYARILWGLERISPELIHGLMSFTQKWVGDFRLKD
jgi:NAD(P)-dependent dehydrogenase (short-subunit alcohol dehydrogenase family)